MSQVNGMQPTLEQIQVPLTPTSTLDVLVQGPVYLAYLRDRGVIVSDSVARQQASSVASTSRPTARSPCSATPPSPPPGVG